MTSNSPARSDRPAIPVSMMVLAAGAVMRLTRLVTKDKLTEDWREAFQARHRGKVGYLVGCPWCTSFWVGLAVAGVTLRWPRSRTVVTAWLALAASHAAGMVGNLDPPDQDDDPDADFAADLDDRQLAQIASVADGKLVGAWADGVLHDRRARG